MSRRFLPAFVAFSVIVLLSVCVWSIVRVVQIRRANIAEVEQTVDSIKQAVVSDYLAGDGFSASALSTTVRGYFRSFPALQALVIHNAEAVTYLYARSGSYIDARRDDSGAVVGLPEYRYASPRETLVRVPMVIPDGTIRSVAVVATVLSRNDMFPIVREVLIALLSFLLITAVAIMALPYFERREGAADLRSTPHDVDVGPEPSGREIVEPSSSAIALADVEVVSPQPEIVPGGVVSVSESTDERRHALLRASADAEPPNEERPAPVRDGLYSPESGLGWEGYLEERLNTELKRAASFDQDLVLLILSAKRVYRGEPEYRDFAERVREYFTFRDLCFEYGAGGVAVIVPNIDLDQGIEKCEDFLRAASSTMPPEFPVSAGLSARTGRLMSGNRLIREAGRALQRATAEALEIVAFRVDPEKYRSYIASRV